MADVVAREFSGAPLACELARVSVGIRPPKRGIAARNFAAATP